jgi:hypothetical protein
MASVSLRPNGVYSVCDLEKIVADFTGQGVMQDITLDATDFATAKLQNGQCVRVAGNKVYLPDAISDKVLLHASPCEIYEDGKGRESFAVERGKGSNPRLFVLNSRDEFSTNACYYDDGEFETLSALKTAIGAGTVFAVATTTGDWKLTATTTNAVVYGEVLEYVTLSNDRDGVRIRII